VATCVEYYDNRYVVFENEIQDMRQQIHTNPYIYFRDFKSKTLIVSNVLLQKNACLNSLNTDACEVITLLLHIVEWTFSGWVSLPEA
jgi:hypothetical protein